MVELELVGIHSDGEHLILIGPDGERHRLAIDEALRAAVRRDRPQLEKLRVDSALRPRDIQVLIRAGASAEDVASESGLPVEQVRRYEGPVLAERQHVVGRARVVTIGRDPSSPQLGDLVVDRLAARGVDASAVEWDARRHGSEPWQVIARFVAGEREREAAWEVDLTTQTLTALDDESRWLSETELGGGSGSRRHLSAVRGARLYDVETDADIAPSLQAVDAVIRDSRPRIDPYPAPTFSEPAAAEPEAEPVDAQRDTDALLAELSANRGIRQPVVVEDDEPGYADDEDAYLPGAPSEVFGEGVHEPTLWDEMPGAHSAPPATEPQEREADVVELPAHLTAEPDEPEAEPAQHGEPAAEAAPEGTKPAKRAPKRSRRTSVPSWDEIVFGAKND